MTTPRGAPELVQGQAIPETTVNEQVRRTEAGACHFPVTDRVTAPPGSCVDGANYLIIATATGAFAGKETQIATAVGTNAASGWYYHTPIEGFTAYVMDENARYLFDGAAWGIDTTGGSVSALDDLTDVDAASPNDGDVLTWDNGAGEWIAAASGGGGGAWVLVDSEAIAAPVAQVDFTGLGGYSELQVILQDVTTSASGRRFLRVSTDNGSSYDSTSGNYQSIDDTGTPTNTTLAYFHNTGSASARSAIIQMANVANAPKVMDRLNVWNSSVIYVGGSLALVNAIRVANDSGNLTGGTIYLLGRV